MREDIKQYVIDRDEMLLKCNVEALKKFVGKYEKLFPLMFVDSIARANDKVLEITLHKMIVHSIKLPFDYRQKSADWLLDRGYSLDLGEGAE